jgi:hypothetical protein
MNRYFQIVVLELILLYIFWTLYGLFIWKGEGFGAISGLELLRKTIKDSVYYPALHIMPFFTAFPIMTVIVIAGSIQSLFRYISGHPFTNGEALVLLGFWIPLLALGLTREWIPLRYIMPLYLLFITIFDWAVYQGLNWIKRFITPAIREGLMTPSRTMLLSISVSMMFVLIPILNEYHGIRKAMATGQMSYSLRGSPQFPTLFPVRADHKGAAEYVGKNWQENDLVIAMDVLQQYYYLGKVDYWLREASDAIFYSNKRDRRYYDFYTNTPVLTTKEELERLVNQERTYRVWVITSGELTGKQAQFIPYQVSEYLSTSSNLVFTGQDGETRVYLF